MKRDLHVSQLSARVYVGHNVERDLFIQKETLNMKRDLHVS